jgi:hypothetical protein
LANELQADDITGRVIYFQVRSAIGQIWNILTAAFENYTTANIAHYNVPGTEQGTASGFYAGNMPAVPSGVYNVIAKEQAGGSPAETDRTVATGDVQWNGSLVSDLGWVRNVLEGDRAIDTVPTPWAEVITIRGTATELARKKLRDVTGANITATTVVIGSAKDS